MLHVPWFLRGVSAQVDGHAVRVEPPPYGEGRQIVLPPDTRLVVLKWPPQALPELSYPAAVGNWKRENRARFNEFVGGGGQPEPLWTEEDLALTEAQRQEHWADLETQHGIAVGCWATASASIPGLPPDAAVDGSLDRSLYWAATPAPQWWQVDLGQSRRIDRVRVVTYWDDGGPGRAYEYRVLASTDGARWQVVADLTRNREVATPAGQMHSFAPTTSRFVRVEILSNSANEGVHLVEVEVFPAVAAPLAGAPARSVPSWEAEKQAGAQGGDMAWGSVSAQRIVLQGSKVERSGDRVRLVFRGGQGVGIAIGEVSLALTDPAHATDIVATSRTPVTFAGANAVELPPGGEVASDWVRFGLAAGRDHTVTFSVLRTGGAALWPDTKTVRFESPAPGAALKSSWARVPRIDSYNLYFLARVEVPQ